MAVEVVAGTNDKPTIHVPGATYIETPCESHDGTVSISATDQFAAKHVTCQRIVEVARFFVDEDVPTLVPGVRVDDPDANETFGSVVQVRVGV